MNKQSSDPKQPSDTKCATYYVIRRVTGKRCFFSISDYECYRNLLRAQLIIRESFLHAYVLTRREIHLLLTVPDKSAIFEICRTVEAGYQRQLNQRYSLQILKWNSDNCISPVCSSYILPAYSCVENLPVILRLCENPAEHPWSSYRYNVKNKDDSLVNEHPVYSDLHAEKSERSLLYLSYMRRPLNPLFDQICRLVEKGRPLDELNCKTSKDACEKSFNLLKMKYGNWFLPADTKADNFYQRFRQIIRIE